MARDNGNKLKEDRCRCNKKKSFLTLRTAKKYNRLARVVVPPVCLEGLKTPLDKTLSGV